MSVYVDPNRLFRIKLPPGFARDEQSESLVFVHDDFSGRVNVSCYRAPTSSSETPDLFEELPSRDQMQNVSRGQRDGLKLGYGDYLGEFQNEPIFWRWWTLQRGPVCVVLSYNGDPGETEDARQALDALAQGVQVTRNPPLDADSFTQMAAHVYSRVIEGGQAVVRKPLELGTGGSSLLRLENAYVTYLDAHDHDPATDAAEMLHHWFERLWGSSSEKLGDFPEVRGLIYPVLKPASFARDVAIPVLRRPLIEGDLEILMAVDTGRTLRFLSEEDLKQWPGVSLDDVFFYARENLLALCRDMPLSLLSNVDGRPSAAIISTGDNYDASKVILPDLYHKLAEVLGPEIAVGVPNRDFMIAFSLEDEEMVRNIAQQVREDAQHRPYAISGRIYRLSESGLEPYQP